jgi:Family of unknown function (DUF6399)
MKVCSNLDIDARKKARWGRMDNVKKMIDVKIGLAQGLNQTNVSKHLDVPRTTLQYWLSRKDKTAVSPTVDAFFETPDGLAFLHQLVIAAQFTMNKLGSCGSDIFSEFMRLSQLYRFVANSHGAVHKLSVAMEEAILTFEKIEKPRLASKMPKKKISICQDETFHPEICLVAIEPVSNYILLEEYSDKRDAESWSLAMQKGLENLPIEIIQSTSDEGSGLIKYVEKELGVQHSPDLFHVQQDLTRATSAPIRAKIKQAEKACQESAKVIEQLQQEHDGYAEANKVPYSWSELDKQMDYAKTNEKTAKCHLDKIKKYQDNVKEAKKALGDVYHPYDLKTGKLQPAEEINAKLESHFSTIKSAADELELSENSMKRLDKAHRVFQGMINTIIFFWAMVKQQIASLGLSTDLEAIMYDILIPGFYLQMAAKKARNAAERHRIVKLSEELLARLDMIGEWQKLPQPICDKMKTIATDCARLFQRSSSCVEGRNGYLSLRHHSSHHLSDRKLRTLTIIHNYFIRRPDGTTAAERFFEEKPQDLFQFLLDNLAMPSRPAKSRKGMLMAA